jgi:capsular polysaccharide biosynthesis protein
VTAVEANDVMLRIVWRHRWLLIVMIVWPIAFIIPFRLAQPVTYAATSDIQAQLTAPTADTQAVSILNQVSAIATSPEVVQKAINAAKVDRNAVDVAKHQITTTPLGSSAVVTVTVNDPNRVVAAQLSRALGNIVVGELNAPGAASSQQLATLTKQEAELNASRASLLNQLNEDQANDLATTDPQVEALITELAGVETQLSANQTAQQQVLSNSNVNQDAAVISEPTIATTTATSRQVGVYTALAALLGLIIGLLIATIDELARPTLSEPEAGARELGVALLGTARSTEDGSIDLVGDVVTRAHLAASRIGALTLVLTGPIPPERLSQLASTLNAQFSNGGNPRRPKARVHPSSGGDSARSTSANDRDANGSSAAVNVRALSIGSASPKMKIHALPDLTLLGSPKAPALVIVLRRFAPRASLDQVADLGETTGWPILGVMGLEQKKRRRFHSWSDSGSTVVTSMSGGVSQQPDKVTDQKGVRPTNTAAATKALAPEKAKQHGLVQ